LIYRDQAGSPSCSDGGVGCPIDHRKDEQPMLHTADDVKWFGEGMVAVQGRNPADNTRLSYSEASPRDAGSIMKFGFLSLIHESIARLP